MLRAIALLGDDFYFEGRSYIRHESHFDFVGADALDALLEIELAPIQGNALGREGGDDVLRGDRAKEAAVIAGLLRDGDRDGADAVRNLASLFLRLLRAHEGDGPVVLDAPYRGRRR